MTTRSGIRKRVGLPETAIREWQRFLFPGFDKEEASNPELYPAMIAFTEVSFLYDSVDEIAIGPVDRLQVRLEGN